MQSVFDSSLLNNFDDASELAHGLPSAAYTSDDFFQIEQEQLFANGWVFVGYAHEMPKTGDALPIEVGGLPIFLVRNQDNRISAFHNVCRHRNLKLIDKPDNCGKLIRCPYHSWSYDLCGALKNAPFFGGEARQIPEDFRFEDNGLVAVDCEVWHDWVFVNLSKQALDFPAFLQPIKKLLGDIDVTDYVPVTTVEMGEVACNWKLLMENFIEPYHVQFVHKDTTSQPLQDHYTVVEGHCLGSAVELSEEQQASARAGTLGVTSNYLTLFPNFVMGTYQPDQIGVHLNEPVSANRTNQRRVIYVHKDSDYSAAQIQDMKDLWYSVHLEDHEMCLRLQQGRKSPLATQGGVLSPHWENSVRKFQELVADAIRPGLK
jgi:choline monooxygenase